MLPCKVLLLRTIALAHIRVRKTDRLGQAFSVKVLCEEALILALVLMVLFCGTGRKNYWSLGAWGCYFFQDIDSNISPLFYHFFWLNWNKLYGNPNCTNSVACVYLTTKLIKSNLGQVL